jgi:hypothetical protein
MFAVIWVNHALDALADVFVSLDLAAQDQLTASIERLNRRLGTTPFDEGESRSGDYRLTFVGALSVLFRVDADRGVVRVTGVKWHGP